MVQGTSGAEDIMLIQSEEIKKVIAEYIRAQLEEDYTLDQMSIKEYTAPFTGSKNSKA